jgi:hypothetical protein
LLASMRRVSGWYTAVALSDLSRHVIFARPVSHVRRLVLVRHTQLSATLITPHTTPKTAHTRNNSTDRHSPPTATRLAAPPSLHHIRTLTSLTAMARACANGCGWTQFGTHATCCTRCKGDVGPHSHDCHTKNAKVPPLAPDSSGAARGQYALVAHAPQAAHTLCCARQHCRTRRGHLRPHMPTTFGPAAQTTTLTAHQQQEAKPT